MALKPGARTRLVAALAIAISARLLFAYSPRAQVPLPDTGPQVILRGGWLFTAASATRIRHSGSVIVNGTLAEIGAVNSRDPSRARLIDVSDAETILPGLFDLRAHLNMNLVGGGRVDELTYHPPPIPGKRRHAHLVGLTPTA